jgi:DNA polymerase-3 subunit beta
MSLNTSNPKAAPVKFTIDGRELFRAVHAVGAVIKRRTVPVLMMVRIDGGPGGLYVEATDMDLTLRARIEGDFPLFATCVEYRRLHDFLRLMAWSSFTLEVSEDSFVLKGFLFADDDGAEFDTLPAADFPAAAVVDIYEDNILFLPQWINHVKAAISTEETRYYLNGVHFDVEDGMLRLVATDGHRMRIWQSDKPWKATPTILPRQMAQWLTKTKGPGVLHMSHTHFRYAGEGLEAFGKCIDGSFPDYRRVIPKDAPVTATLNREEFMRAIAVAKVWTCFHGAKAFRMEFKDGYVHLRAKAELGRKPTKVDLKIAVQDFDAPEGLSIGFNAAYMADAVRDLTGETVTLRMLDGSSPVLIEEGGLTQILMPLRV